MRRKGRKEDAAGQYIGSLTEAACGGRNLHNSRAGRVNDHCTPLYMPLSMGGMEIKKSLPTPGELNWGVGEVLVCIGVRPDIFI